MLFLGSEIVDLLLNEAWDMMLPSFKLIAGTSLCAFDQTWEEKFFLLLQAVN